MEFRPRNYVAEEQSHSLPRSRADIHPFSSSSPQSILRQVDDNEENRNNEEFFDPLRAPDSNASVETVDGHDFESSSNGNDDSFPVQTKEWTSFKRFLMQRFPVSKMISVSSVARLLMDTSVSNFYPTLFVLVTDVLNMLGDMVWERIRQKAEFAEDGARLCSLRAENFRTSDVPIDAKETCYNWFCKVGSIRELLPRIYLELAIFPCWRFLIEQPVESLQRLVMMTRGIGDPLASAYCRLYIAHRAQKLPSHDTGYLITCLNDITRIFTRISSTKESAHGCFADSKRSLVSLMEPSVEFIMKCILNDASQRRAGKVLVELGLGRSQEELFGGSPCVSIVLHHLLKQLPIDIVSFHAVDILHLIKCSNDNSYDQCLNYRLVGLRLSEQISQIGSVEAVVNEVIQVVSEYGLDEYLKVVDAYLDIVLQNQMRGRVGVETNYASAGLTNSSSQVQWPESKVAISRLTALPKITFNKGTASRKCLAIQTRSQGEVRTDESDGASEPEKFSGFEVISEDGHLKTILEGISKLASDKVLAEDELASLQSILVKLLSHFKDLEHVFSLNHFLQILDTMHGNSRGIVNMHILDMATRNGYVHDPTTIQLLFEISQALHSDTDLVNMKNDDNQQQARLISRFVRMVDHGVEYERHLAFLMECRGALGSIVELKEILVHSSNCLATKALKDGKKHTAFVKTCMAFSEITIPSIPGHIKQLNLYLGTAEVALLGGLVSHSDGLIDSAINCLQSSDWMEGNPEVGILHIPKSILLIIHSRSWSPRLKARILCAIISLSATLSQERLPYHADHTEIMGNDLLFFGDSSYVCELLSLTESVLQNLVDVIEQEPSRAARGSLSLEACNCIASSFKINEHVLSVCSKLIETAKLCLNAKDKYLTSTISFLDKNLPAAAVSSSIAI
ncbi:hypothetical protein GOBAR_AA20061 [Gossypium barbadense]|uniref:Uncharacterized protein n=1 Tax=Gossypium barbadense TaxID=3634 RepID=A0A2P5XBA7_GOSBA|nr:hypothetical protein GOBAR_AA20061 [Gossypium barbadense]